MIKKLILNSIIVLLCLFLSISLIFLLLGMTQIHLLSGNYSTTFMDEKQITLWYDCEHKYEGKIEDNGLKLNNNFLLIPEGENNVLIYKDQIFENKYIGKLRIQYKKWLYHIYEFDIYDNKGLMGIKNETYKFKKE